MKRRTKPIDTTIGANVRAFREEARMSQQALGDAIGCTFQQIQKYEKATNRVAASTLFLISKVFDVPIDHFFTQPLAPKAAVRKNSK